MFAQSQTTEGLIAQVVFLAAMAMIAFSYAGYPALMFALSHILKRPVRHDDQPADGCLTAVVACGRIENQVRRRPRVEPVDDLATDDRARRPVRKR